MTARQKTKYPNIYKYQTKKGMRYQVRTAQVLNSQRAEFYKGGILTLAEAKAILADVELKFSQGSIQTTLLAIPLRMITRSTNTTNAYANSN